MSKLIKFLDENKREIYIQANDVFSVLESTRNTGECWIRTKSQAETVLVLCSLETAVSRINTATETDYKVKYEKCISVINRFDPGIVGMYDL